MGSTNWQITANLPIVFILSVQNSACYLYLVKGSYFRYWNFTFIMEGERCMTSPSKNFDFTRLPIWWNNLTRPVTWTYMFVSLIWNYFRPVTGMYKGSWNATPTHVRMQKKYLFSFGDILFWDFKYSNFVFFWRFYGDRTHITSTRRLTYSNSTMI